MLFDFIQGFSWYFSLIYLIGNFLVARKEHVGWIFRVIGAVGWCIIGFKIGLFAILAVEIPAAITSVYGYLQWKNHSLK